MKKLTCIALCLILLCSMAACNSADKSVLAGTEWDMTRAEVVEKIGDEKVQEGSTENVLNWMLTKDLADVFGDRTVSVAFVFTEDKMSSITVQIFTNEGESVEDGMKATRAAMEKVYGAASGEEEAHWHGEKSAIALRSVKGTSTFFVAVFTPISAHSH